MFSLERYLILFIQFVCSCSRFEQIYRSLDVEPYSCAMGFQSLVVVTILSVARAHVWAKGPLMP